MNIFSNIVEYLNYRGAATEETARMLAEALQKTIAENTVNEFHAEINRLLKNRPVDAFIAGRDNAKMRYKEASSTELSQAISSFEEDLLNKRYWSGYLYQLEFMLHNFSELGL